MPISNQRGESIFDSFTKDKTKQVVGETNTDYSNITCCIVKILFEKLLNISTGTVLRYNLSYKRFLS